MCKCQCPLNTLPFGKLKRQPLPHPVYTGLLALTSSVWGGADSNQILASETADTLEPLPSSIVPLPWQLTPDLCGVLGGNRMAAIVPEWYYYPGMPSCACSLGLFTDDFLDHFPQPSLGSISSYTGAMGFCTSALLCQKPAATVSG